MRYELKLANGKTAEWDGTDGYNAAFRYVDAMRVAGKTVTVIASRPAKSETHGMFVLGAGEISQ